MFNVITVILNVIAVVKMEGNSFCIVR